MMIKGLRFEHFVMLLRGLFWQFTRFRFDGLVLKGRGARIFLGSVRFRGVIKVGNYATLDLRRTTSGQLGHRFSLGDFSVFRASGSSNFTCPYIYIAERVSFGPYCNIGGGFGLQIGADVIAGPYVSIHPEEHLHYADIEIRKQKIFGKGVLIHDDCWLGAKATILDGSQLSLGTVLGAAALVAGTQTKEYGIYVGIPARLIGIRESSELT